MTAGYSIPKDALENPFARALIKDEPLVYDTEHTPLIDRQAQLCLLCEKWLKRDKQTLSQCVDEKRLRELKSDGHPSSRDLCDYIHARKKYDPDFKQNCQTHSLEEVCRKLEQAFNWGYRKDMIFGKINIDTLQKYLNRHGETIATI